ncbi:hypothetical protein [Iodobacter ciconiae]|uniref:Uncharacterized protein n=1 Tax=Iodobacter ciconiae TaxID=2496266 RepID=A0A3S8ZQ02_9NEIS|nr:hypothetical protein [Iodobacter ciconiae]AZN35544.1 hypothetical protein EJO50_03000 [Iodobacter ciconiae]
MNEKDARDQMISAIASSKYRWRTARGISKDSGLVIAQVLDVLDKSDAFIRARKGNARGELLYTTKERYKSETSLAMRVIGALTNKISE